MRSIILNLFDRPTVYEAFHLMVSGVKIRHLKQHLSTLESSRPLRVLDMGCGPGTNAALFIDRRRFEYLGIDTNPTYIEHAEKRYALAFKCADATRLDSSLEKFDVVLINSVMHHITPELSKKFLRAARDALRANGVCLILDMVEPVDRKLNNFIQRTLIRLDRGQYCRTFNDLRNEIENIFKIKDLHSFSIRFFGLMLWDLRLFVARI